MSTKKLDFRFVSNKEQQMSLLDFEPEKTASQKMKVTAHIKNIRQNSAPWAFQSLLS